MAHLRAVALAGVALIVEKTRTYGPSWKRRGGPGAWFTTVRPWDRLEQIVATHGGDVFAAIEASPEGADGSALGCLRDIRNYTILVEAEMVARGVVASPMEEPKAISSSLDLQILAFDAVIHTHYTGMCLSRITQLPPQPKDPYEYVIQLHCVNEPAQPGRAYVDQDTRQPSSLVAAAAAPAAHTGDLGAGPIVDGRYTVLDIGHGADLWHEGLGALPWYRDGLIRHTQEREQAALRRSFGPGCLIASRPLEGGDFQVLIRLREGSGADVA